MCSPLMNANIFYGQAITFTIRLTACGSSQPLPAEFEVDMKTVCETESSPTSRGKGQGSRLTGGLNKR
jgi:hypothetical protein